MMKFLTTALGGLTVLTVTGMVTPSGQAMLGMRQTQATAPVSVIADPGPATVATPGPVPERPVNVAPAASPAATPAVAAPAAAPVVTHPAVSRPAPVARPAAPAAATPAANPMGGAGAITNILLNLPQVLQGTQGGPQGGPPGVSNGGWVPPGQRARKHHDGEGDQGGDFER